MSTLHTVAVLHGSSDDSRGGSIHGNRLIITVARSSTRENDPSKSSSLELTVTDRWMGAGARFGGLYYTAARTYIWSYVHSMLLEEYIHIQYGLAILKPFSFHGQRPC